MTYRRNSKESEKALNKCKYKCVICGWNKTSVSGESLVQGCHIKELAKDKKSDVFTNIIAMCPNHHKEFDAYNFYIDAETHKLRYYDSTVEYEGRYVDIGYVNNEFLAYRQYEVLKYWNEKMKDKKAR